jgi:uncharacterized tellurite resistance protein B-like protein
MIAAAWMDGKIGNEKINSLKDLLFHLPDMTAHDWSELEIYLETPVGPEERARLIAELQGALSSRQDRELALHALEDVIQADGTVSATEQAALQEIRSALEHVDTSIFGQVGRLLRTPVERRSEVVASAPNREMFLEDFIRNKIYYNLSLRLGQDSLDLNLPEPELRKLSLAGGLMARVAYVDREVTAAEFDGMAGLMQEHFGLRREAAGLVAEVAVSTISKDLDNYRLTREFFEHTDEDERLRFLRVLFAVAAADGIVSHQEMEEIRTIATVLKLNHDQFIDAKLSIPRERRAY